MAKLLTCEVALSDGTEQYYALESYVMQCLLKMAGCTNPTIVSDSDSRGVHGDSGKDNYTLLFIDDSISKKNNVAWIVANYIDELLASPEENTLTSIVLTGKPTTGPQFRVDIAPIITMSELSAANFNYYSVEDVTSYNIGQLPSQSSNSGTGYVLPVLHAHIRYRLAIMDDDKFKTLVEAWKTCIVKTLSGLPVTFSNEAVQ